MECVNDALIATVKALGGSKQVGPLLWPEKTPDAAQRCLLDSLNPERPNRLSPEQVVFVLRLARQRGYHEAAEFLMHELGYAAPVPVEPRDEAAELQRQFIAATEQMALLASRMQALQTQIATPRNALRAAA